MKIVICAFIISLLGISCTKDEKPEQVLRSYINMRFQENPNLSDLIKKTTGELEADLKSALADKEKWQNLDRSAQFKNKKLKILARDCGKQECRITYIVSYQRESKENPYKAEIRNVANLKLVEGIWKIASIGGLKSYFEAKKDIEPNKE